MQIGLGIDTGGTYTDAVIYSFDNRTILSTAKALTTKENLIIGIQNAIKQLNTTLLNDIDIVSLSTTLATNSCVEGTGGLAKLILIGGDKNIIARRHSEFGLPEIEDIYFVDGKISLDGELVYEPDWNVIRNDFAELSKTVKCFAISGLLASRNPILEFKIRDILLELGCDVVCSCDLATNELNYIKRASTALLNARLIPVISDFLNSIRCSLKELKITAPVYIVRSDGSLMSEKFAEERPIETLLCGPTSSVVGAMHLTGSENAIVVDIGGTTCDLAMIKDGVPIKTADGIKIGAWQTSVNSTYISTFGLGGDSHVRIKSNGEITLGPDRVVPLCVLADRYPIVCTELQRLNDLPYQGITRVYEFLSLVKNIDGNSYFTPQEHKICEYLKDEPKSIDKIAEFVGLDVYTLNVSRLEKMGIIIRSGFTPTDVMHINNTFNLFNKEASILGANYFIHMLSTSLENVCKIVYEKACYLLYNGIVKMLIGDTYNENTVFNSNIDMNSENIEKLILKSFYAKESANTFFKSEFNTSAILVAVGAPTHIFIEDTAKKLNTTYIIPQNAHVANAIGAIVCNIDVTHEIFIKPVYNASGLDGHLVLGTDNNQYFTDYQIAVEYAKEKASIYAQKEASRRGLNGTMDIQYYISKDESIAAIQDGQVTIDLGTIVRAKIKGKIFN